MAKLNPYYANLTSAYLFPQIEKKVATLLSKSPEIELINLGIGDITKPLAKPIIDAMVKATSELEYDIKKARYGPSTGFQFLKTLIAKNDYANLEINEDEIFISNGSKSDLANLQELFDQSSKIAICDPTYPVYIDSNVMAGRSGKYLNQGYEKIVYLPCKQENNFYPELPNHKVDVIYLCSPNNPTGIALNFHELKKWIDYALSNQAIIIYDGAYEAFINSSDIPHSIYEIEGAKKCAIEVRSFSKKAGFTGLRCSYTVIPSELTVENIALKNYWIRRCETKFGGVPYPIQKAAAAVYLDGKNCIAQLIKEYKVQMETLTSGLNKLNLVYFGGKNSPYVWLKAPSSSWDFFDTLLTKANIISVPGSGFGTQGEGYIRLSAFESKTNIEKAVQQLTKIFTCATQ